MAAEALDIRMARLEDAYVQINERLGALEQRLTTEIGGVRGEIGAVRAEVADMRKQMVSQFYWLLSLVLGSILIPLIRELVR